MIKYLKKRRAAFHFAGKGIRSLFRDESHPLLAALCVIAAGIIWRVSPVEWCLLLLCIGGVFMAEGFNTAVEKLADRITTERDPLIGAAKDIAAGSVLPL